MAERTGVQACWDRFLEIRKKHGANQTGPEAAARALTARREWQRDPCSKRVEALRYRIVVGPLYKKLPDIYDDVMSGHQPALH